MKVHYSCWTDNTITYVMEYLISLKEAFIKIFYSILERFGLYFMGNIGHTDDYLKNYQCLTKMDT